MPMKAFELTVVHPDGRRERVEYVAWTLEAAAQSLARKRPGCQIEVEDAVSED